MTIGGGSVAGIGLVEGVECLISANVSTHKVFPFSLSLSLSLFLSPSPSFSHTLLSSSF